MAKKKLLSNIFPLAALSGGIKRQTCFEESKGVKNV